MADDTRPDSPGQFINEIRDGVRRDVERDYATRLADARAEVRRAQDQADAEYVCAVREEMGARMAEYRRGHWYDLGAIITSGISGFVAGYIVQKKTDLRIKGAPVLAIAGLPGIVAGTILDESMTARASLAVGGALFMVGTATAAVTGACACQAPKQEGVVP